MDPSATNPQSNPVQQNDTPYAAPPPPPSGETSSSSAPAWQQPAQNTQNTDAASAPPTQPQALGTENLGGTSNMGGSENSASPAPPPPPPVPGAPTGNSPTPPTVTPKKGGKGKFIILIIILLLLVSGAAAAFYFVSNQQSTGDGTTPTDQADTAECTIATYDLSDDFVYVTNTSDTETIESQEVTVYIDGVAAPSLNSPQVGPGETEEIGTVSTPEGIGYEWEIVDANGCSSSGSVISSIVAQCINIRIFNEEGVELTSTELRQLQPGDTITMSVAATALEGTIDAAKFIVNGIEQTEITTPDTDTGAFSGTYTLADDVTTFTIDAELLHSTYGWF